MALVEYFSILLVVSGFLTVIDLVLSFSYRRRANASPVRVFIAVVLPVFVSLRATKNQSLTLSGAIWAFFFGLLLTMTSFTYTASLLAFFFTSSRLTKFRKHRKFQSEHTTKGNPGRDWLQVVANGGIPAEIAMTCVIDFGFGVERPISFSRDYSGSWYDLAVLGALACAAGDTWASELGSVLGSGDPILITTFQHVPRGTNGGISFFGTLASGAGGCFIGLVHWICINLWSSPYLMAESNRQYLVVVVGLLMGLMGSIIDSFFGAVWQYSGYDESAKRVVEEPGDYVIHISGSDYLSNNAVNFLSCFSCALLAPYIGFRLWNY